MIENGFLPGMKVFLQNEYGVVTNKYKEWKEGKEKEFKEWKEKEFKEKREQMLKAAPATAGTAPAPAATPARQP